MGVAKNLLLLLMLCHLLLHEVLSAKCPKSYACRNFTLEFPFTKSNHPDCGLFMVDNCDSEFGYPAIQRGGTDTSPYFILGKPSSNKFLIQEYTLQVFLELPQCFTFTNFSLLHTPLVAFTFSPNITFFTCYNQTPNQNVPESFQSYHRKVCKDSTMYYKIPATHHHAPAIPGYCSLNQLPMKSDEKSTNLLQLLTPNFTLEWSVSQQCSDCHNGGGQCSSDNGQQFYCRTLKTDKGQWKVIIAICIPIASVLLLLLAFFILWQRKKRLGGAYLLSRNLSSDPSSKSDIEDGSFHFGIPIFSYTELVEATGNFDPSKELGDGGFGTVYYGKLRDGREVAIKRLYEHNYRRVEQFLNEIKILTSLRHPNLVSLYGCTSRRSRELLLVYEYVPNGTVADHLHGVRAEEAPLTWAVRMNIARETATALAYLHKSDIIHRDVKTNNILIDSNFSVKVADFGLSRLFPMDVTHISTAPQGTPGYVDPEYHQCYQLTDKSDVYSFGVVLIELISSMPAVDISRHKHEINLANLAVNKIQKCAFDELIDPSTGYKSDVEATRMTMLVAELAFRCLQLDKDMRPSMEEVVAFLRDIQSGEDCSLERRKEGDGKIPPSPETDEAVLLKSKFYQSSPTAVTDAWISSSSTVASSVG